MNSQKPSTGSTVTRLKFGLNVLGSIVWGVGIYLLRDYSQPFVLVLLISLICCATVFALAKYAYALQSKLDSAVNFKTMKLARNGVVWCGGFLLLLFIGVNEIGADDIKTTGKIFRKNTYTLPYKGGSHKIHYQFLIESRFGMLRYEAEKSLWLSKNENDLIELTCKRGLLGFDFCSL